VYIHLLQLFIPTCLILPLFKQVVLVGGGTRMPSVRKLVETVTGLLPRTTVNPDEAVALGAGIHAGMLDGVIGDMEMMTPMQVRVLGND
jgi:molecular chaperone DnaK